MYHRYLTVQTDVRSVGSERSSFSSTPGLSSSSDLSALLPPDDRSPLAAMLSQIDYVTVAVVNLEYPGHVIVNPGFGHLVPSSEPSKVLGVVYDSCAFPAHDPKGEPVTRLTVMMGGAWFGELFGSPLTVSHSLLEQTAIDAVREQLGIVPEPSRTLVTVQQECIPQFRLGHHHLLEKIKTEIAARNLPLYLIGPPYNGISVNDCIQQAKQMATLILRK